MSDESVIPPPFFCLASNIRIPRTIAECDAALMFILVRLNSIQQQIDHDAARGVVRSADQIDRRDFARMRWDTRYAEFQLRKAQLEADEDIDRRLVECKAKNRKNGRMAYLLHNGLSKLRGAVKRAIREEYPDAGCVEALPEPMQALMAEASREMPKLGDEE